MPNLSKNNPYLYTLFIHNAIFMEQIDQYPLSVAISWVSCVNIKQQFSNFVVK